ncbi:MAG TPA: hypothetical protein VL123_03150 [Candidatus Udaeobacter sp.]|jgi:hypothetical protein|nr:hypothetical protein [Candidatus Udaeobacter sp.]
MNSSRRSLLPFRLALLLAPLVLLQPRPAHAQPDLLYCWQDKIQALFNPVHGHVPLFNEPQPTEITWIGVNIAHGDVVPLPQYPSDGAFATDSELFWIVRPATTGTCADPTKGPDASSGQLQVSFAGRQVSIDPPTCPGGGANSVWVTVMAFRDPAHVPVRNATFGSIKAKYRP